MAYVRLLQRSAAPAAAYAVSGSILFSQSRNDATVQHDEDTLNSSNISKQYLSSLSSPLFHSTTCKCEEKDNVGFPIGSKPAQVVNNDSNGNNKGPADEKEDEPQTQVKNDIITSEISTTNTTTPGLNQTSIDQEKVAVKKDETSEEKKEEELFHGMFPLRQLWHPKVEYPLWDKNWDNRALESTGDLNADRKRDREIRKKGVTKHIILIRHGQYDETHKEDEKRILTPLGRQQAELTGMRLAKLIKGIENDDKFTPCNITTIRVSDMARAKETAGIIAKHLPPSVHRADPDANLNEGRPCYHIPGAGKASPALIQKTEDGHKRIEEAFETYFHRAQTPSIETDNSDDGDDAVVKERNTNGDPQHEFEIIVCHANVIRYFFCRALQIPPEAWLRLCTFNCSLTYLTIRPTGTVSCRMLGDIGHLEYDHTTFSMHHGFNW